MKNWKQPTPPELDQVLAELRYPPDEARQLAQDIRQGEELLRREDSLRPDPAVLARTAQRLREELKRSPAHDQPSPRPAAPSWAPWAARAAAVAALLLLVLSGWWMLGDYWSKKYNPPNPGPKTRRQVSFEEGLPLWELALGQPEETRQEIDSLLLSEVLALWGRENWDVNQLFREETNDENLRTYFDSRVGSRLA